MEKNPKWSIDKTDPIQIAGWGKVENLVGSVDEMFIAKNAFTTDDFKQIISPIFAGAKKSRRSTEAVTTGVLACLYADIAAHISI